MKNRWLPGALALLAAAPGAGCEAANDQVLAIVAVTTSARDPASLECEDPAEAAMMGMLCGLGMGVPFISRGVYDVGVAVATGADYLLKPVLTNRAMMRMVQGIDVNTVFPVAYDLELVVNPKLALAAAIPASVAKRTVQIGGPILGTMCMTYLYDRVPAISATLAKVILDAGVLSADPPEIDSPVQELTVRLRYHYSQSGSMGVSNWLEFPVELCLWCNAQDPNSAGKPAYQKSRNALVTCMPDPMNPPAFGDPCSNGPAQDVKTFCCYNDKTRVNVCGPDIPTT